MPRNKKVLTVEHSTPKTNVSKVKRTNPDPEMLFDYREIPISENRINKLVESLDTWVEKNPESKEIQDFYYAHNIPMSTYYLLLNRTPRLKEMHEKAMRQMGGRLLSRSIDFKANWNPVKWIIGRYAPEYAQLKEDEAMLAARAREQVNATEGPQIVVIEKFPDSPLVKGKDKNNV